jgi:hypothetical protein
MAPTALVSSTTAISKYGDKGPLGNEIDQYAVAARLLGFNMRSVDISEAQYTNYKGIEAARREYRMAMSRVWKQEMREGNPDYEGALERVQALNERMLEAINKQLGNE